MGTSGPEDGKEVALIARAEKTKLLKYNFSTCLVVGAFLVGSSALVRYVTWVIRLIALLILTASCLSIYLVFFLSAFHFVLFWRVAYPSFY